MEKRHFRALSVLLLAVGCLLWLPACKKESRTTHIKGRVTEYGTGTPITGACIYLFCDQSVVFGPSGSSLADSIVTDTDGRFDRTYAENELCGSVFLLPYKEGYFQGTEIDLTTDFKELNVVLDPEAWLRLVTIPDLQMWASLGFGGSISPHAVYAGEGIVEQLFLYPGTRSLVLHWGPFDNPGIIYSDSIYLAPHDTTTYTIHY